MSGSQTRPGFVFPTQMPIAITNACGSRANGQLVPAGEAVYGLPQLEWDHESDTVTLTYMQEPLNNAVQGTATDTDIWPRTGFGPGFSTWTNPRPIADTTGVLAHHASAYDPVTKTFALGAYGTDNDPALDAVAYWTTYSVNGTTSFKPWTNISTCFSGEGNVAKALQLGNDYTAIAAHGGKFLSTWADNCAPGVSDFDVLVRTLAIEDCTDGLDNDGDGLIDAEDPLCSGEVNCADGIDNDLDGAVDCADPDCCGRAACAPCEVCGNGIDDDGDSQIDCADADCCGPPACPGTPCEDCRNGIDDDGDSQIDCADTACAPFCPELCGDAVDNDADGLADCADVDCEASCPEICTDFTDNDGDLLVDCADPECPGLCVENCTDRVDNDRDGLIDGRDPDCARPLPVEICDDGIDNDGDALVDTLDPDCAPSFLVENCGDGIDNDNNRLADCADPECVDLPCCCPAGPCGPCE